MSSNLKSINNEMKSFVNEASGISIKCKRKLVSLIRKHFKVDLPDEDYKIMNIEILENGNIMMRDIEYKTETPLTEEQLYNVFEEFKKDVESLLDRNATSFDTLKKKNETSNLILVSLILLIAILLAIYSIHQLIIGDYFGFFWLVIMIGSYVIPATGDRLRDRFEKARRYLKSILKK